jgi:hypothetical protein
MTQTKRKKNSSKKQSKDKSYEEFKVQGKELVEKVKDLIKKGNVRRIIIKNKNGKSLMEIPVTIAVVGTVFAPILAALGAMAALISECSIVVEKKD